MQKIPLHIQYIQSTDLHHNIISSFFIYKSNNALRKYDNLSTLPLQT